MIRVLLADDQNLVRRGVSLILSKDPCIRIAREVATGREVIHAVLEGDFDLVVMGLALPEVDSLEVLAQLRCLRPRLPVLILSKYADRNHVMRAMKSGANGYLTKDCLPEELITAIAKVASGGKYVSEAIFDELLEETLDAEKVYPHEILSEREFQVMSHLALGRTIAEISDLLMLSTKTISTYRARILKKLELKNNAELVRYALERDMI